MSLRDLLKIILPFVLIFAVSSDDSVKDVIIDSLEMLEGDDIVKFDIKVDKVGPTKFIVNATLKQVKQFDDNWKIRMEFSQGKNTEPFLMYYPSAEGEGICEFLKKEYKTFFYETLKDYSNAPHYETCPLEPNEYIITNYPFDANVFLRYILHGSYEVLIVAQQLEDVVKYKLTFSV